MTLLKGLITVIVPVYNIEDCVPRCLESIIAQTYQDLEIIIVDDASIDKSGEISESYASRDPRVRVIHHEKNQGLSAARNTGMDAASGEYIWLVDGDDYVHRDMARLMLEALANRPDVDVAITGMKRTDSTNEDTSSEVTAMMAEMDQNDYFRECIKRGNVWNKLYRASFIGDLRFLPSCLVQRIMILT